MLEEIIKNYLINTKGKDAALFDDPNLQMSALGLDSLDMVEMLFEIEDRCGFQLPDPTRYPKMGFAEMLADIEAAIRAHNDGEMPDLSLEAGQ
ncbi:acyl carrier protein [Aquitalea sp. ASV11]|uniref:acyl carrier protein n=1 Tax=Aquitalea sp. ASV11 TaxID=2795103 RepID=UPI0018EB9B18|nr:acyl carrier protein [Aquitalea sp. ASV11]